MGKKNIAEEFEAFVEAAEIPAADGGPKTRYNWTEDELPLGRSIEKLEDQILDMAAVMEDLKSGILEMYPFAEFPGELALERWREEHEFCAQLIDEWEEQGKKMMEEGDDDAVLS